MARGRATYAPLRAGLVYFAIVFAIGFILGVVRVLVVAPRVGEFFAVLLEMPLMLAAAWMVCSALIVRFQLASGLVVRLVMGFTAFALLMAAEAFLSTYAFGNPFESVLAAYLTPSGLLGLGGQVLFALFPAMHLLRR